ncbi:rolling circle replication-associated protein [Leucothrix pacifica]|uniref:Replication-associated protein ORF2/G2P domain-containing protein n=1 Tax=Leucothrix pacifica TaxID=1247513 RepID=A0A317CEJ9_9GAMM|nr:hypothetical protein [Leucothrix pacifica]PWQ95763.1 hypothetical protein DKW60_14180 [Leucothrix pacifica]
MKNIIDGAIPQSNSRLSGLVDPAREKMWAEQLKECLVRYKKNKAEYNAKIKEAANSFYKYDFTPYYPSEYKITPLMNDWSDVRMVSEVIIGEQDVQIKSTLRGGRPQLGGGIRGAIKEWSKKSRSRCERHIRNVPQGSIVAFLTLTYPKVYTNDGKAVKRDLATMVKRLKRMGVSGGIWFLEFQKRGAPHVHAFLGQWPSGGAGAVARAWYEVVGSGDEKHLDWHLGRLSGRPCLEWMRNQHAASYYACKYAVKSQQKDVPEEYQNVGRFWGCWGGLRPVFRVFYARGGDACRAAVDMVRIWKLCKFGGHVGSGLSLYSATLRGCTFDELAQLFDSTGWCPD